MILKGPVGKQDLLQQVGMQVHLGDGESPCSAISPMEKWWTRATHKLRAASRRAEGFLRVSS